MENFQHSGNQYVFVIKDGKDHLAISSLLSVLGQLVVHVPQIIRFAQNMDFVTPSNLLVWQIPQYISADTMANLNFAKLVVL